MFTLTLIFRRRRRHVFNVKILALDTSGQQAGAAIMDEYITIGEIMINAQSGPKTWHHSEILMPAVESMFTLSGHKLQDMDYVAYTAGPGSFTGLRIGAATALGLARGIGKPAIGVPTLDALAYNVLCMGSFDKEMLVVPLMDARRGQVYAAVYSVGDAPPRVPHQLSRQTEYLALPIEEIMTLIGSKPALYLGDGADANKPAILSKQPHAIFAPQNCNRQRPASVALCALHQLETGTASEKINLIYIRDPQAVRAKKP